MGAFAQLGCCAAVLWCGLVPNTALGEHMQEKQYWLAYGDAMQLHEAKVGSLIDPAEDLGKEQGAKSWTRARTLMR